MKYHTLYLPDFKGGTIFFVNNFVPSDDDSITSNCFFMLGKMGKPNQTLWVMPFHVVGICTQWYSPNKFEDIDSAMKLTVEDKTILSKAMILLDL